MLLPDRSLVDWHYQTSLNLDWTMGSESFVEMRGKFATVCFVYSSWPISLYYGESFISNCLINNGLVAWKRQKFMRFEVVGIRLWIQNLLQQLPDVFHKKDLLEWSAKFTGKHLCRTLFLKKRLRHRCFPVNFVKILRTPFLQNTSEWLLTNLDSRAPSLSSGRTRQSFGTSSKSVMDMKYLAHTEVLSTDQSSDIGTSVGHTSGEHYAPVSFIERPKSLTKTENYKLVENMQLQLVSKMMSWEAVAQGCSVKNVFLEISQNSHENICVRVSF